VNFQLQTAAVNVAFRWGTHLDSRCILPLSPTSLDYGSKTKCDFRHVGVFRRPSAKYRHPYAATTRRSTRCRLDRAGRVVQHDRSSPTNRCLHRRPSIYFKSWQGDIRLISMGKNLRGLNILSTCNAADPIASRQWGPLVCYAGSPRGQTANGTEYIDLARAVERDVNFAYLEFKPQQLKKVPRTQFRVTRPFSRNLFWRRVSSRHRDPLALV
jgi:hypothetical protein